MRSRCGKQIVSSSPRRQGRSARAPPASHPVSACSESTLRVAVSRGGGASGNAERTRPRKKEERPGPRHRGHKAGGRPVGDGRLKGAGRLSRGEGAGDQEAARLALNVDLRKRQPAAAPSVRRVEGNLGKAAVRAGEKGGDPRLERFVSRSRRTGVRRNRHLDGKLFPVDRGRASQEKNASSRSISVRTPGRPGLLPPLPSRPRRPAPRDR